MKEIDLFGSQIQFRFNRQPAHNTRLGSLFTMAIVSVICLRLTFIIKDVFQRNNPIVIFQERQVDDPKLFNINKNTFQLAFGMQDPNWNQYIDEGIYNVKLTQIHRSTYIDDNSGEAKEDWVNKEVQLRRCTLENFPDKDTLPYFQKLKYNNMYCLPVDEEFFIEGDFNSKSFYFLRLVITKCKQNCKPDTEIEKNLNYSFFTMQFSDITIDPTKKSDPFKKYSRDLFFTTSLKMPKDVEFYMRNNYIESDFGWVGEDLQTLSFPQFSRTEQSVYPSDYADFLFQMTIRFEKQKENYYQRKYKNINSIVSEIGGFTQSLLAIGFLVCARLSQLDLNKEIINDAFNFENVDFEEEKLKQLQAAAALADTNNVKSLIHRQQEELSIDNIQQSYTKRQQINNSPIQKPQISQPLKADLFQLYNSENRGIYIKPIPLDPHIQSNKNHSSLVIPNGIVNQNLSVSINQSQILNINGNKMNSPNNKRISKLILPQQKNVEDLQMRKLSNVIFQQPADNEKQFLSYLIQNPTSRNGNRNKDSQEELQYPISADHEKLRIQQQKLEEKGQKLKESIFKKLMHKATSSMNLNMVEYLKFFFWPFGVIKQKKKIIDYSIDKLYYHLDVLYVVKKLMEVDKLKRIFLNPDQLSLFEYIPKPTIKSNFGYCKDESDLKFEIDTHYQDNRTELQKAQQAYQSFQNIINKQNISVLDQKIVELLDQKLLNIFGINQSLRQTFFGNPVSANIETSLSINQISQQKNVKEKQTNSNSDEDHKERKGDIFNQIVQNQPQSSIAEPNSPRFDSQRSMFSEIAGNEAYQKQNEIHEFENTKRIIS